MNNKLTEQGPVTNAQERERMADYKSTAIEQLKESGPLAVTLLSMGRTIIELEIDYNNEKYYKEQYFKNWQDKSSRVDSQIKVIAELRDLLTKEKEGAAKLQDHINNLYTDMTQMKTSLENLVTEREQLLATIKENRKIIRKYAKARR